MRPTGRSRTLLLVLALGYLASCGPVSNTSVCDIKGSVEGRVTLSPDRCAVYHVTGDVSVSSGGRLTIKPGAVLSFAPGTGLTVFFKGELIAAGNAKSGVLFTGDVKSRGSWKGIAFAEADSPANRLDYVIIEYAGGEERSNPWAFGAYRTALDLRGETRLQMTNCTIRESAGYGMTVDDAVIFGADASIDGDFSGNTITANAGYPVAAYASRAGFLAAGNDFSGNDPGKNYVRITGNSLSAVPTQTWQKLNVPYLVNDLPTVARNSTLTIAPGARLVFERDAGLLAYGQGAALKAVGTSGDPVVFTGLEKTRGYWAGLHYYETGSYDNVLSYAIIEYGGSDKAFYNASNKGNVVMSSSGSVPLYLMVDHCDIRDSGHWGVWVHHDTTVNSDIDTVNDYASNTDGDFKRGP